MDLAEKDEFGLEKRTGDHMNYHTSSEWQFSNQSIDSFSNIHTQSTNPQNPILNTFTMAWNTGILPPTDSGFIERAARFSSFAASEPLSPYSNTSIGLSGTQRDNESGEPEFSGDGQEEAPNTSYKGTSAMKWKRSNQDIELDIVKLGNMDTKQKGEVVPKDDYIHVRARRGQATNSHSLAERVRREKISERMKLLQELVPGCSKVTGKAVMLDEIINYVQSLQRQVEFLSMKLATVNIEELLSKDIFHLRDVPSSTIGFSTDMVHPQLHPFQESWIRTGIPGMVNPSDVLRRAVNAQLTTMTGYKESASQMANAWDDELHNVVQMTFGANTSMNTPEAIGKPRDGFPP